MPRDSLVGSSRRCSRARKFALRARPKTHRIGRPGCLENPARRAEYSLTGNPPSPFHAEPAHLGRTRLERVYGMFRGTAVQTESLECLAEIEFALPTSFFTKNQECFIMRSEERRVG